MRRDDIRNLVKSAGIKATVMTVRDLLEGRKLDNGVEFKLRPEQFSLRELWEGMVGDCEETLPSASGENILMEEVNSTGFHAITRLLIHSTVMAAYNGLGFIGDQLITNMPSKRRIETIAGFTEGEGLKDVAEGMPYEDSDLGEKYVTTLAGKKGRLIGITEEAILEDKTGQLLMRAQRIGNQARLDKEKTILNGVIDKFGSVYRPSGAAAAFYSTAHGNLMGIAGAVTGFTTAVPLADWASIDAVERFHELSIKDDRQIGQQEPIVWNPTTLLVPRGLQATALRIRNATEIRMTAGAQVTIFNNPKAGQFNVLSSPYIGTSGLADAAGDWYYGNFKDTFFWQDVWPIQTFSQNATGPEGFLRDVVAIYKVRYLGGVFAMDTRQVVKVKSA